MDFDGDISRYRDHIKRNIKNVRDLRCEVSRMHSSGSGAIAFDIKKVEAYY